MSSISKIIVIIVVSTCSPALVECVEDRPMSGVILPEICGMAFSMEGARGTEPARNPEHQVDASSFAEGQTCAWRLVPPFGRRRFTPEDRGGPLSGFGALPERPPMISF